MITKLNKPTVLIGKKQACHNIEMMVKKAAKSGCDFRPHFKTHQSADIGEWFRQFGVTKIAVSSLDMAEYFANYGWRDISVCVPVNVRQVDQINTLAATLSLHLLVEAREAVSFLAQHLKHPVQVWVEIDTGYHRTGVDHTNHALLKEILESLQQHELLKFRGILTHSGHAYQARAKDQIDAIYSDTLTKMKDIKQMMESLIDEPCAISIGDTPTCCTVDVFDAAIAEIRPGNFIFYDIMQAVIGSCHESEIALAVACPVIATYPERNQIIIYGGAVHLSKEALKLENGQTSYGWVCPMTDQGWGKAIPGVQVVELTQEHGKITAPPAVVQSFEIGSLVGILPVHSCLTANLFSSLATTTGEPLRCFRM